MQSILNSKLREQAGSNSFNRFDYQAHWIVYHMISEFKRGSEFFVFCEFHDDMAKAGKVPQPDCAEFFQIKTTEKYNQWTLSRLTNTTKKRNGSFKHSFLGFIFYNFLQFGTDCAKCHFVSNIGMDKDISAWQSVIEDENELKRENRQLYEEIKTLIRSEFQGVDQGSFNLVFENFIQNTFIYHGDLTLDNYEKVVAGEFFQMLDNTDIFTSNSNKILRDIIEDVRKKSKKKVEMPISFKRLKDLKGVSSDIFAELKEQVNHQKINKKLYHEIETYLTSCGYSIPQCKFILRRLKEHHNKLLDISNSLYQDTINEIVKAIDKLIEENYEKINDINFLKGHLFRIKEQVPYNDLDDVLLEAILYERLLT